MPRHVILTEYAVDIFILRYAARAAEGCFTAGDDDGDGVDGDLIHDGNGDRGRSWTSGRMLFQGGLTGSAWEISVRPH